MQFFIKERGEKGILGKKKQKKKKRLCQVLIKRNVFSLLEAKAQERSLFLRDGGRM